MIVSMCYAVLICYIVEGLMTD